MNFDGDAVAGQELIDGWTKLHHCAHIFVARGIALVERKLALDHCGQSMLDDLEIRRADGDSIDAHQNLGGTWFRDRLLDQSQLFGATKCPGLHGPGDGIIVAWMRPSIHRPDFPATVSPRPLPLRSASG